MTTDVKMTQQEIVGKISFRWYLNMSNVSRPGGYLLQCPVEISAIFSDAFLYRLSLVNVLVVAVMGMLRFSFFTRLNASALEIVVVVVVLLYVHDKHLSSCWDGQIA